MAEALDKAVAFGKSGEQGEVSSSYLALTRSLSILSFYAVSFGKSTL